MRHSLNSRSILLFAAWFAAAADAAAERIALTSLSFAALLLPLAFSVQRHGWRAERSLRTVALTLATPLPPATLPAPTPLPGLTLRRRFAALTRRGAHRSALLETFVEAMVQAG